MMLTCGTGRNEAEHEDGEERAGSLDEDASCQVVERGGGDAQVTGECGAEVTAECVAEIEGRHEESKQSALDAGRTETSREHEEGHEPGGERRDGDMGEGLDDGKIGR